MRKALASAFLTSLLGASPSFGQTAVFTDFRYEGHQPANRSTGLSSRDYLNPILAGSRADPSIARVGRDYYLANSSFGDWPGAPIWQSRDLVHWRIAASAIDRADQVDLSEIDVGWQGLWAPDLKYHDGWFYLFNTCYGCGGIFAMRARTIHGPWPRPVFLHLTGIDPSIFFDTDGRAYVLYNGLPPAGAPDWDGHRAIWLRQIDLATLTLRGEPILLIDGGTHPPEHPFWIEGPHLFRKDGRYYLIAAQGGTNEGHSEVVFRADALRGPYVSGPNPILSQIGLDPARPNPVVNAGHADMVETPKGDWWAVFLASRPYKGSGLTFNTGRDTFLLPVTWRGGWPIILPPGQPVPLVVPRPALPDAPLAGWPTSGDFVVTDHFTSRKLAPGWSLLRNGADRWWRVGRGALTLQARPIELGADRGQPSFVGLRQAHVNVTASVTVRSSSTRVGDRTGVAVVQDARRWFFLAIARSSGGICEVRLIRRAGNGDPAAGMTIAAVALPAFANVPIGLRIEAEGKAYRFAYRLTGSWHGLGGEQDGLMLSNEIARGFTGVMIGPAAIAAP